MYTIAKKAQEISLLISLTRYKINIPFMGRVYSYASSELKSGLDNDDDLLEKLDFI